jgi:hypothetical protein
MGMFMKTPPTASAALGLSPVISLAPASAPALPFRVPAAASGIAPSSAQSATLAAAQPVVVQTGLAIPDASDQIKMYWGRLVFASVFLLVILIGGFIAAVLKLNDWSTLLIHSFELLLGIFIGLLGGDIAAKKTG